MTNRDITERLESLVVPDFAPERHRRELRALLTDHYDELSAPERRHIREWLRSRVSLWKPVLVTSATWAVIAVLVIFMVIIPNYSDNSVAAMAVETVMDSPLIRTALAGDDVSSVTVSDLQGKYIEVMVESRGGALIIATVTTGNNVVSITEISYVLITGSIYQEPEPITGDKLAELLDTAYANPDFKTLLEKGADVISAEKVECIISTRNLTNDTITDIRETWAMVTLTYDDENWYFLVDPNHGRVINRSRKEIPE